MKTELIKRPQLNYLQEYQYEKTAVLAGKMTTGEAIALKPVIENLGLDWSSQLKKIKRDENLSQLWSYHKMISKDGKSYDMVCLPPMFFQEWLWQLNASGNLNIELWNAYKKGLVVYLMDMLKVSLDEVKRLRNIETLYDGLLTDTKSYFEANDEGLDLSRKAKGKFKEQKEIKERILSRFNTDPDQLILEFQN